MVMPSVDMTMAIGDHPMECQCLKLLRGSSWHSEVVTLRAQSGSSGMGARSFPSSPMQAMAPSPIWMQNENQSETTAAMRVAPYLSLWRLSAHLSDTFLSLMCRISASVRGCPPS